MRDLRNVVLVIGLICGAVVASNGQNVVRIDLTKTPANAESGIAHGPLLEPDAATRCYGFFCRQELKGDKMLPVPLRVRLGSMQQNDWLEQKNTALPPVR